MGKRKRRNKMTKTMRELVTLPKSLSSGVYINPTTRKIYFLFEKSKVDLHNVWSYSDTLLDDVNKRRPNHYIEGAQFIRDLVPVKDYFMEHGEYHTSVIVKGGVCLASFINYALARQFLLNLISSKEVAERFLTYFGITGDELEVYLEIKEYGKLEGATIGRGDRYSDSLSSFKVVYQV